ncbi:MAG: transposase, partial [Myxococcales bacterium]|nr:transposase [Myxococcales bacterium]
LYGYWNVALDLLFPVAEATLSQVLDDSIVRIDDTGLRVLDKAKPKGAFRGHLWAFKGVDSPMVGYQFTKTWKAEEIAPPTFDISGRQKGSKEPNSGSNRPMVLYRPALASSRLQDRHGSASTFACCV